MHPPRLLICGFGAFPAAPRNPSGLAVEALAADGFRPGGIAADYLILPVAWRRSAELVLDHLARTPAIGVLAVGVAVESDAFRVETLARNCATGLRLDHEGERWPLGCVVDGGSPTHAAAAPSQAMLAALTREGLPARLSDDAGDYLCNFVLYRLLAAGAPAGFLHVPQAREFAANGAVGLAEIERAVRVAAAAFAGALTPAAAGRPTA